MEIDVNQAELRVLAELSRDPVLVAIYTTPGSPSIHKVTQTEMFGDPDLYDDAAWLKWGEKFSAIDDKERTLDEQNMRAKTVNFGIVYGRTAPSIAEEFKMPVQEAAAWIQAWFRKYAGAHKFIMQCRNAPLLGQNLITPFGRKRRFQIVNQERLNDIQNQAANFPEQSIACDCVTHTGMIVQEMAYYEYNARIVNTVYDSLLFELPDNKERALELGAKVLKVLGEVPKKWGLTHIPFKGDIKLGRRWGTDNKRPEMGFMSKTPIPEHILARVS
jgi:DNA polymerase-1